MKYYINQDFKFRVFNKMDGNKKMSRYYSFYSDLFYNYVSEQGGMSFTYREITLKAILEECEREKVDYLIYYYCNDLYEQSYRFKELLIFKELLEGNR